MSCLLHRYPHSSHIVGYNICSAGQICTSSSSKVEHPRHGAVNLLSLPPCHAEIPHCLSCLCHRKLRGCTQLSCLVFKLFHIGIYRVKISLANQTRLCECFHLAHGVFKLHSIFNGPGKRTHNRLRSVDTSLHIAISIKHILLCLTIFGLCLPSSIQLFLLLRRSS